MSYAPYLTAEHEELRKKIRSFINAEIVPHIEQWEAEEFPSEIIRKLGEQGFLGLRYPKEAGGQGLDYFAGLVFAEEMCRSGFGGLPMGVAVQTDMATPPILEFGNEDQIERFFKPSIQGEKIACLGITEPDYGSDVASIQTNARLEGDEWVINGSKIFITNGPRADFITLVVRTSNQPGYKGISLILVEMDRPGVSISKHLDKVGMRSSDTAEIMFEDVRVPKSNLLGREGKGFAQIMWELQGERMIAAASCIGSAGYVYDYVLDYAKNEQEFGQPLAVSPAVSRLLAEMKTEIEVCKEMTYALAYRFSRGEVPSKEISMVKMAAAQMAHWVADRALQIIGDNAFFMDCPIQRMWRDTRLNRIGAGTDEVMKEIIAKQMGLEDY